NDGGGPCRPRASVIRPRDFAELAQKRFATYKKNVGGAGITRRRGADPGEASPLPAFSWLTVAGERVFARHGVAAVVMAWAATRLLILLWVGSEDPAARTSLITQLLGSFSGDIKYYYEWSGAWLHGQLPYRDVTIQY